jgi:curved DNA-binding protein
MAQRDLYEIMGVSRDAPEAEIRKTYRRLARKHHPDVNPNDPKAEERFKQISYAYDVLSDARKRKLYDEFGEPGLAEGFDAARAREYQRWQEQARRSPHHDSFRVEGDLEDLLSGMFGGAGFRGRSGPLRGSDAEGEIEVDLLDAALGREVRVEIAGRGTLRVRVPAGATEETRVRLPGQGQPGPGGGAGGDLYLRLRIRPDPLYTREGDDLLLDLPVTVPELVQGASIEIPTPDGAVSLRVPEHSRAGQKLRLRGKGAYRRGGKERGDLYARLSVQLPDTSDPRMDEIARQMQDLYEKRDVRSHLRSSG